MDLCAGDYDGKRTYIITMGNGNNNNMLNVCADQSKTERIKKEKYRKEQIYFFKKDKKICKVIAYKYNPESLGSYIFVLLPPNSHSPKPTQQCRLLNIIIMTTTEENIPVRN